MDNGFLYKDRDTGVVHVGKQVQNEENAAVQKSIYADKRAEFMERNNELQESFWRGRDSQSMNDVKNSYRALNDFMSEEIPADDQEFEARKTAIVQCYDRLISHCEAYINGHKNPFTKSGKRRKAIVEAIMSSASLERLNVIPAIEELKSVREEGMIWGNVFGQMQENVDLCVGVYDGFERKFPEGEEVPVGARTLELAKVVSASYALTASEEVKDNEKGMLISKMSTVWLQHNMNDDLKKEFRQFRKFVTKILVNNYRTSLAYAGEKSADYIKKDTKDRDLAFRQFSLLMIVNSENFGLYRALNELALYFEEDPVGCGVQGEEMLSGLRDTVSFFTELDREKVGEFLKISRHYRRVEARSILDGFVDGTKLDNLLGASLKGRQNDAVPLEVKRPLPKDSGKEKLDGDYDYIYYIRKVRDTTILRDEATGDAAGENADQKIETLNNEFAERYGIEFFNHDLCNSDNTVKLTGLNSSRIFGELLGPLGGHMNKAQIAALYDKLLARSRIGTGEGKISAEEADRLFNEGMDDLIDIYLDFMKRMETTYGRLMGQMHPEDILRQFGDEYYCHIGVAQDLEQVKEFIIGHYDLSSFKAREFIFLADYFINIHSRTTTYLSYIMTDPDGPIYAMTEGQRSTRELLDVEKLNFLTGPQMTPAQKKKYNENLKKRFHKKGGNWDSRIFSEFRGVKTD